ncbi:MAG: 3'-5' exonuclease [Flavobacteriales bacterium]|nr:3'-5' exonuclease [Flavobacteriales bacterium]
MLENLKLENILVLDIETVPATEKFEKLDERWQKLWQHKAQYLVVEGQTAEEIYNRAGIYAEFGKIVCISVGVFFRQSDSYHFKIKSFSGDDERVLLLEFCNLLNAGFSGANKALCAHNGKEFDFPYLSRRMLVHGIKLPMLLNTAGRKPWEVNHIDTMQLWKFGDFKSYTSLDLLAATFNIPTPKDDIDGSMVWQVYYEEHDLERIKTYCQKDVVTLANVLLRFVGLPLLSQTELHFA